MQYLILLIIPFAMLVRSRTVGEKVVESESGNVRDFYWLDDKFKKYGRIYNVPWYWLKAISMQESNIGRHPSVVAGKASFDGLSWGVMQIAEGVGSPKEIEIKGFHGIEKNNNADHSIETGAKLVQYLMTQFQDKYDIFLAYNQGEVNTRRKRNFTHPDGRYADIILNNIDHIRSRQPEEF